MLRERLALPGSKNACEQGECGSCSVYLDGVLVCSCLVAAGQAEGREIVTVEGLAPRRTSCTRCRRRSCEAGAVQCGFCTPGLIVATHDLLARNADARPTPRSARRWPGNLCRCTGYEKILDAVRLAGGARMIVIDGCAIATVDADGTESRRAHRHRRTAGSPRSARARHRDGGERIDGRGCLATPGLINCHHHLYQWATRGLAQQATLFEWLVELVSDLGAHRRRDRARRRARRARRAAALAAARRRSDHHYVFPRDGGDLLAVEIEAARELGIRFHPCRGSMDLGKSDGGLPPDSVVEDRDAILAAYADAIDRFHDPSPGSMLRIALAPCSPFSVTQRADARDRRVARARGVRLHTHMAETVEEEAFCLELFGVRPVEYLERARLARRRRLARALRAPQRATRSRGSARRGTGVAHCPSSNARLGAGIAPVVALVRRGRAGRARRRRRRVQRGG